MNRISQYFGKNPKKRDLSCDLKTGDDDSKKPREGSSESYTKEVDVFEEVVDSADCQNVLFNCLNNLEQKMNDLYMLAKATKKCTLKATSSLLS